MTNNLNYIIKKEEATKSGLLQYFTGKPCKAGHVSKRYASTSHCIQCALIRGKGEFRKNYLQQSKSKIIKRNKVYYKLNKDKFLESSSHRRLHKAEEIAVQKQDYYNRNKVKFLVRCRLRQASLLKRTPSWANLDSIEAIYKIRESVSRETGIIHHVDHIIPLSGKAVSGLHVENNLQVIPALKNLSKKNKFFQE